MTGTRPSDQATSVPQDLHAHAPGAVVLVGFGSIGRGLLPLLVRHIGFDPAHFTVIDPDGSGRTHAESFGAQFMQQAITRDNYRAVLEPLLTQGGGQGLCINVSVDVSSVDVMRLCHELDSLYIDSSVEPWEGYFHDKNIDISARTNYALREMMLSESRARNRGGATAVSSCGANPGMVSWLVKEALVNLAADLGIATEIPETRRDWAKLMQRCGVKGMHIAERDTQRSTSPKPMNVFVNTWSVEGMVAEGLAAAEIGWGTHERWLPPHARRHKTGCLAAIYMLQSGGDTRVRSWCPTPGPQRAFLVPHHESIAIADYYTLGHAAHPEYRPTVHYAYRPSNVALLSLEEMFERGGKLPKKQQVLGEEDILDGMDELGVLLYGHAKNAYWYGSQLTIEQARALAPHQNATGLQVSSGVLAGIVWALENPDAGIVEADDMDFRRCLEIQRPYLGNVAGYYTDWHPLKNRGGLLPENLDRDDPWQFKNVLVRQPA
jgi:homospermidine synthase